jgi:hypothetical protein
MIVNVTNIPEQGLKIKAGEPGEILGLSEADGFVAAGAVDCDLYTQVVDGVLIVRGTIEVPVKARVRDARNFSRQPSPIPVSCATSLTSWGLRKWTSQRISVRQ